MKALTGKFLRIAALILAATPLFGGNIVVTGHDDDFHSTMDGDPTMASSALNQLIAIAKFVRQGAPNPSLKVLIFDHPNPDYGDPTYNYQELAKALSLAGIPYDVIDPDLGVPSSALFDVTKYSAIGVASDQTCGGCDNTTTSSANLQGAASSFAAFINAGGGVFALAGGDNAGYYSFLPKTPLSIGHPAYPTYTQTAVGQMNGIPADNSGNETHNVFAEPGTQGVDPSWLVFETFTGDDQYTAVTYTDQPITLGLVGVSVSECGFSPLKLQPPPTLATATATEGQLFTSGSFSVTGGTAPFTWAIGPPSSPTLSITPSSDTLTAVVSFTPPAGSTSVSFMVSVNDPTTAACPYSQTYAVPVSPQLAITSLNPTSAPAGSAAINSFAITGTGFSTGATVSWNGSTTALQNVLIVSLTQITAQIPASLLTTQGMVQVVVNNSSESSSNQATFTITPPIVVPPPTITGLSPSFLNAGAPATPLTITGTGFATAATVSWTLGGQTTLLVVGNISATQITATIPASLLTFAGTAQVTVSNPAGPPASSATITINAPLTVTSFTSSSANAGSAATNLNIAGTGFVAGAAVGWTFGGQTTNLTNVQVVSGTEITATVPENLLAEAGSAQISVMNANGISSTSAQQFVIYPLPTVSFAQGSLLPLGTSAFSIGVPSAADNTTGTLSFQFVPASDVVNPATGTDAGFVHLASPQQPPPSPPLSPTFSFPAGQTTAALTPSDVGVQAGTVAGTISVTVNSYNGVPSTVSQSISAPATAPQITSVKIGNVTTTGFVVCVAGYSPTRDITGATYQFTASSQGTLKTTQLPGGSAVTSAFTNYYQGATATADSMFLLEQTFTLSGSDNAIGSLTVTLQNGAGSTTSPSVTFSGSAGSCN